MNNSRVFNLKGICKRVFPCLMIIILTVSVAGCKNKLPKKSEPIVGLSSCEIDGIVVDIAEAGKNRIAVSYEKFIGDLSQDPETVKHITVIDIAKDELVIDKEVSVSEDVIGFGKKGEPVTYNYKKRLVNIYNSDFSLKEKLEVPDYETPIFDSNTGSVYYVKDNCITKTDLNGKSEKILKLSGEITIRSYDTENGLLISEDGDLDASGLTDYTVFSYRDKKALFTTDATSAYGFTDSTAIFGIMDTKETEDSAEVVENYVKALNKKTGKTVAEYKLPENTYIYCTGNSALALLSTYSFDLSDRGPKSNYLLNLENGKLATLTLSDDERYLDRALFLSGEKYMVYTTVSVENPEESKLFVTALDGLDFNEDAESMHFKTNTPDEYEAPENLKSQRETADKMEKEFSVEILLGDEALVMKNCINYRLVSTESDEYSPGFSDNRDVTTALKILRQVLETYPQDFFKTFKNYHGTSGLRFSIMGDLVNESGEFVPAGVFNYADGWYNIALKATEVTNKQLIHHELWHAIEERIKHTVTNAFSDEDWNALNPENFEYSNDTETYYKNDNYYKLTLDMAGYDAYFIKIYSTNTELEDRATIVEEILTDYYTNDLYSEPDSLSHLKKCPHIKAKIDYMAKHTKSVFGSVYWEN